MHRSRVIPTLLMDDDGLVKTLKFKNPRYIGDPINAVRIFNNKEVDELVLLDITATAEKRDPKFESIAEIVSEAFMPIGYGGGINNMSQIERLFKIGIEKIILNSVAFQDEKLIKNAADIYGNQSVVVSIDVKKDFFGTYQIYSNNGKVKQKIELTQALQKFQDLGAGEIMINSIDREGTMSGYDLKLINEVSKSLKVPVVASGGAGNIDHLIEAIDAGASAVAAGSMFVYQGIHRAVLISYVNLDEVQAKLKN
jgi:cyclase